MLRPVGPTRMLANPWHLPVLDDVTDLTRLLDLAEPDLDWFADLKRLARSTHPTGLQHYRVSTRPSPSGARTCSGGAQGQAESAATTAAA